MVPSLFPCSAPEAWNQMKIGSIFGNSQWRWNTGTDKRKTEADPTEDEFLRCTLSRLAERAFYRYNENFCKDWRCSIFAQYQKRAASGISANYHDQSMKAAHILPSMTMTVILKTYDMTENILEKNSFFKAFITWGTKQEREAWCEERSNACRCFRA